MWDRWYEYPVPSPMRPTPPCRQSREIPATGESEATRVRATLSLWPRTLLEAKRDLPGDVVVKNTFLAVALPRPPSLDEFLTERQVKSCPASGIFDKEEEDGARVAYPPTPDVDAEAPYTAGSLIAAATLAIGLDRNGSGQGPPSNGARCAMSAVSSSSASASGSDSRAFRRSGADAEAEVEVEAARPFWPGLVPPSRTRHQGGAAEATPVPSAPNAMPDAAKPLAPWWRAAANRAAAAVTSGPVAGMAAGRSGADTAGRGGALRPRRLGAAAAARAAAVAAQTRECDSDSSDYSEDEVGALETSLDRELGSAAMPTVGSAGHYLRVCKPCAFVTKGCQSGIECRFCHLCEVGEKKRRKKEKVTLRREVNKWRHSVTAQWNMTKSLTTLW